jgi:hypothetical protein
VRAIVRGALDANDALLADNRRPEALLGEIQIVELYESTAARAAARAALLDPQHPAGSATRTSRLLPNGSRSATLDTEPSQLRFFER